MPLERDLPPATAALLGAAWMNLGRPIHAAAMALVAGAATVLALGRLSPDVAAALAAVLLAGGIECAFALRTAFDQPVFAAWAARWCRGGAVPEDDLAAFDRAIGRPLAEGQPPAGLPARLNGARRLLRGQAGCLAIQVSCALYALAMARWGA